MNDNKTAIFKQKAIAKHGDKYGYEGTLYEHWTKKVQIFCKTCKIIFMQIPSEHIRGRGCKQCAYNALSKSMTWTHQQFVATAEAVHGKIYGYDNSVYKGSQEYIEILCKQCNVIFTQIAENHIRGRGCRQCADKARGITLRKTNDEFKKEAKAIHGDIYSYEKSEYTTLRDFIEIICTIHKESFFQCASSHLKGHGCPKCAIDAHRKAITLTFEQFASKANKIHNGAYRYPEGKYVNSNTEVLIRCIKHECDFYQKPSNHLNGNGCPECGKERRKKQLMTPENVFIERLKKNSW